jgi:hypothetical protein
MHNFNWHEKLGFFEKLQCTIGQGDKGRISMDDDRAGKESLTRLFDLWLIVVGIRKWRGHNRGSGKV